MAIPQMNGKTIDYFPKIQEIATPVCALVRNDSSFERATNPNLPYYLGLTILYACKTDHFVVCYRQKGGGPMRLQESGEMYLETIYMLSKERNLVRAIDVVEHMGYSKPSVSRAVGLLKQGGYLVVEDTGNLLLTDSGREIGEKIYARHKVLTKMLTMLGVDEKTAAEDACKMEHAISDTTFEAIRKHLETRE